MSARQTAARWALLLLTSAAIGGAYLAVVRPAYLNWGATAVEQRRVLPGDEIVPFSGSGETRAITIQAPIDRVWPWLAQVGQDRGGFYSFDLLENLVGCRMPTDDVLRPERQVWQPGDKLWMYPPERAGGAGFATLRTYEPGRVLGFGTRLVGTPLQQPENGSWTWVLEPAGVSETRLLIRGRGAPRQSWLGLAFDRAFFEPVHFMMERRMMIGLKQLVDYGARDRLVNHWYVVLFALAFGLMIASALAVLRRHNWMRATVALLASAALFQVLTLAQPPPVVGTILVIATAWLLGREARTSAGLLAHA